MSERKSYIDFLKEVAGKKSEDGDFTNTANVVDTSGPMTDNILGYRGNGELQTHKSASDILERYYFDKSDESHGRESISESTDDVQESEDEGISRDTVPGESIDSMKKEIEKDLTEDEETTDDEDEDEKDEEVEVNESQEVTEADDTEQAVIQKLISEMEESESVSEDEFGGAGTRAVGKPDEDPESAIKEEEEEKDDEEENGEDEEDLNIDKKAGKNKKNGNGNGEEDEEVNADKKAGKNKNKKNKNGNGEEDEEVEEKCSSKHTSEWGTGLEEQDDDEEEKGENGEDEDEEDEEVEEGKNSKSKKKANEAGPVGGPLGHNKSSGITHGKYYDEELQEQDLEAQFEQFERAIEEEDVDNLDSNKAKV